MTLADRWLLPEGVDEALPEQAAKIEHLRRTLLDLHESWGYHLVIPPLLEYLDSLLTGAGSDLENETFKVIDQLSGRLLGIRADFTSQVARIDAHCLKSEGVQRLSYCGSVLRSVPSGLDATRSPIQLGAEIYGHGGVESDIEVLSLMLQTLSSAGLSNLVLDLGHVDIVGGVLRACDLNEDQESKLIELYKTKDLPELDRYVDVLPLSDKYKEWLIGLPRLCGGAEILKQAADLFGEANRSIHDAIVLLDRLSSVVCQRFPSVGLHFDLSDLVSYSYHTGVVFAAYVSGYGNAVARGGRYNNIGQVFGRSRPATGFSTDVKALVGLTEMIVGKIKTVISPVCSTNDELWNKINELRVEGYRVIEVLNEPYSGYADFKLDFVDKTWQLVPIQN